LVDVVKLGDAVMFVVAVVVLTAAVWLLTTDAVLVIVAVPAGLAFTLPVGTPAKLYDCGLTGFAIAWK